MALPDGQTGGRAGAARDAQTRGHYFCSKPRRAPHPGRLIKPRGAAPRPDAKHLCRPRPAPAPALAAPPLPVRQAEGSAAHPRPRPKPERATNLVTLVKSLISAGPQFTPYEFGRDL